MHRVREGDRVACRDGCLGSHKPLVGHTAGLGILQRLGHDACKDGLLGVGALSCLLLLRGGSLHASMSLQGSCVLTWQLKTTTLRDPLSASCTEAL